MRLSPRQTGTDMGINDIMVSNYSARITQYECHNFCCIKSTSEKLYRAKYRNLDKTIIYQGI